jgi:alpha-glucosidase
MVTETHATHTLQVDSPSGKICVKIWMAKQLNYYISYDNIRMLDISSIDLELQNNPSLTSGNSIRSSSVKQINEQIISPVPEKRKIIPDIYCLLTIQYKKPFKVEFRVYDDGVAYRISTSFKYSITIINELAEFNFPGTSSAWFPTVKKRPEADVFHTGFEEEYPLIRLDSIQNGVLGYSPILISLQTSPKIAITESDL